MTRIIPSQIPLLQKILLSKFQRFQSHLWASISCISPGTDLFRVSFVAILRRKTQRNYLNVLQTFVLGTSLNVPDNVRQILTWFTIKFPGFFAKFQRLICQNLEHFQNSTFLSEPLRDHFVLIYLINYLGRLCSIFLRNVRKICVWSPPGPRLKVFDWCRSIAIVSSTEKGHD